MLDKKYRLLIVEDDENFRFLLTDIFESKFLVDSAGSVAEAHMIIGKSLPHIVLTDYNLPEDNGITLIRNLKELNPALPVILMTGKRDEQLVKEALTAGVFDFISKPFEESDLVLRVENALQKHLLTDRLHRLAELPTGIVHEIVNPMAILIGNLKRIEKNAGAELQELPEIRELASKSLEVSRRIISIMRNVRSILEDEDSSGEHEPVSLRDLVQNTVSNWRKFHARAELDVNVSDIPSAEKITCNSVQISQVIENILTNSFQAIKGLDVKSIDIEFSALQGFIEIRITDSGPRIDENIISKIFTPFFTTKTSSEGTGLGLSLCRRIVESHNGKLWVDSNHPNTRFIIKLPKTGSP